MKYFLALVIFLASCSAMAQQGSYFYRKSLDPQTVVDVVVAGNPDVIRQATASLDGNVKFVSGRMASIRISIQNLEVLARTPGIERAEIHYSPAVPLNDVMVLNNRVDSVHDGLGNLPAGYSGKGVIVGIIDSGIDPNHSDFKDSLGNSRVKFIWDQNAPFDSARTPQPYNYGQQWTNQDIDNNNCPHDDQPSYWGHGTNVSGTAAGNGLALNKFRGVAYESDLIVVANTMNGINWTVSIVDAVHYIFSKADSLNQPCVINISLGTYLGSHDGKDLAALAIDSLLMEKPGRSLVCANGNAGNQKFHLGYQVTQDTNFTWFRHNPSFFNGGGVYFQIWADTASFGQVSFAVGADKVSGGYNFRGNIPFSNISGRLNQVVKDTLYGFAGQRLAVVETWAEVIGDSYFMEVMLAQPDSNQYDYRFMTTGSGRFDCWSASFLGTSNMVHLGLPTSAQFPDIIHYKRPDSLQTMVSSWTCSPNVLSVGNYYNRSHFYDYNGNLQTFPVAAGDISYNSSLGPNRKGHLKPDLSATGDYILAPGRLATVSVMAGVEPWKVAPGGLHHRTGGTSMASPVVAGMVALLFERCPNLWWHEVIDLVNQSARKDAFTGPLDNYTHGHGKADAMAMMRSTLFQTNLAPSGVQAICDGDVLAANINAGIQWLWNTGDTTATVAINQAGQYHAEVTNSWGCKMPTDTLSLVVNSLPADPVITIYQDMLTSSPAVQYQWLVNGNIIPGEVNQYHLAAQSGWYQVEITDGNGCKAISDSVHHSITAIREHQARGAEVFPNPASNQIHYKLTGSGSEVILTGVTGNVISVTSIKAQQGSIDISSLPDGLYLLTFKTEEGQLCKPFIKN